MNTKARMVLMLALALLGVMALVAMTQAAPGNAPLSQGGAPTVVAYQGEVRVSGAPYTGAGYFKFAVVNAAGDTAYWSNDGTSAGGSEPTAAVQLAVSEGLFSVLLGDTTLGGMTQALTADVFSQPDRYLRVWFSTSGGGLFDQLTPDTRIAAVPYALQAQEAADADTVDGLHAIQLVADYQNVVIVAQSGGDYTSVQAAIDSITDAAAGNPYLVWVAPGVYEEQVTMKPYVHLQGAGQEATVISSTASSSVWPPTQATLLLASDTSLRDLTLANSGAADSTVALLATAGMTRTLVADVTARALGGADSNYAIFLSGSGTGVTLQQVTALAENSSGDNLGLVNHNGAAAVLRGGSFTGRGGTYAYGIFNVNSNTTLEAESVTALGENGSSYSYGLHNHDGAATVLSGGSFTGRGGTQAGGVQNTLNSTLTAEGITALAENGSDNYGLGNYNGAAATLRGGSFTARGGSANYTIAISNEANGATLEAEGVTALAENGSNGNYGLFNVDGAATVRGGSFTARGGVNAYGVYNDGSGTTLEAESVTALGENGSDKNYGLYNYDAATAVLSGGSFIGRGGTNASGIRNYDSSTKLEAESVTALGENGTYNFGLWNNNAAAAMLRGGSFTGRGGTSTRGINNYGGSTTLEAESVTSLAENGSSDNCGLYNEAAATLRGGSFTGRGGSSAYGIYNYSTPATLEAESVTALGENGSVWNYGLNNDNAAAATLRGGSFTGRGASFTRGIINNGSGTTLEAESVTALAENGNGSNYGLDNINNATANVTQSVLEGATFSVHRSSGSVTVSNGRLAGGAVSGTVTCVLVTRGTTISYDESTCP